MIIRSIVILSIGIGYPPSLVANVEANPTEKLIEHYAKVMMHDRSTEKDSDGMVEKLANYIKHLREIANAGTDLASDSDAQGNIVKFPGRILH